MVYGTGSQSRFISCIACQSKIVEKGVSVSIDEYFSTATDYAVMSGVFLDSHFYKEKPKQGACYWLRSPVKGSDQHNEFSTQQQI